MIGPEALATAMQALATARNPRHNVVVGVETTSFRTIKSPTHRLARGMLAREVP